MDGLRLIDGSPDTLPAATATILKKSKPKRKLSPELYKPSLLQNFATILRECR